MMIGQLEIHFPKITVRNGSKPLTKAGPLKGLDYLQIKSKNTIEF